ncbi:hypothetical protein [Paenibacillus apii]|uniref:hypothetical protein n=1 Tax=Paenibacillus apii TaxID=1850370 RepID=UPI00143AC482|nr:hypothetical protein [Paenibacillus apii]NJJ38557.1 hypothetical protein [Paenibacillus apii]
MIEITHYIFSSFWRWLGALLMIGVIAEGIGGMFRTVIYRDKKNGGEDTDNA